MRPSQQRKGFTLIEILIVVAIIGILTAIAAANTARIRERRTVEQQMGFIQSRIERAQAMSAVAGSRLGTNRLIFDASCPAVGGIVGPDGRNPNAQLWVRILPPNIIVPDRYTVAAPNMTIFCRTFRIDQEPNTAKPVLAQFMPVASMINQAQFAFASSGRLILPGAPANQFVYLQARIDPTRPQRYGLRVMASGVSCKANANNPAAPCDEEQ